MFTSNYSLDQYGKTERDKEALKARCHQISLRVPILKKRPTEKQLIDLHKKYGVPKSAQPMPYILLPKQKVHPYAMLELWRRNFEFDADPPGLLPDETTFQTPPF